MIRIEYTMEIVTAFTELTDKKENTDNSKPQHSAVKERSRPQDRMRHNM